jgi:parallel beta-helix repeat protein
VQERQILALAVSFLLCAVAFVCVAHALDGSASAQGDTPMHVATTGIDSSNDCAGAGSPCRTVQHAVDVATEGDVIKVAAGVYSDVNTYGGQAQVVYISKTVTVRGGYTTTTDFADPPDPGANPTTLDARGQGRVVFATGSNTSAMLEGLHLTGGDADGLDPDDGGGFCAEEVQVALLRDSWIHHNAADVGGGVYIHRSDSSWLAENRVYSNTARAGAGVYLHNTGDPALTDNEVYSNTSTSDGAGVYIGSAYYDTRVSGNRVHHNHTTDGGGGGGVYIKGTNSPWLFDNAIYSNTATSQGGGLYLSDSRYTTMISNTIQGNVGRTNGGGMYVGFSDGCTLVGNEISDNKCTTITGGGIFGHNSDDLTLEDNRIHGNVAEAERGGGVFLSSCQDATLSSNAIYSNTATSGGGLCLLNAQGATVAGNEIYGNAAGSGGGIHLYGGDGIAFVNNILWENRSSSLGAGIRVENAGAQFLHSTIARSRGYGDGIAVVAGTLEMSNTILAGNTIGVLAWTNCTATLTGTLWGDGIWANGSDWSGPGTIITGTANHWGDPDFVDAGAGDYHIGPASAAIDRGVNAAVRRDIDDEPRLGIPDLGADEYWAPGALKTIYLPLALRNGP